MFRDVTLPDLGPPFSAAEVLPALLAAALGQAAVWGHLDPGPYHAARWVNALLALICSLAVLWRVRAPAATLGLVIVIVSPLQLVFKHDLSFFEGFLPLIILTSSIGYHGDARTALGGLLASCLALWLVIATQPTLRSVSGFVSDTMFLLLPWFAAVVLRRRGEQAETLAVDLRRVREEQAQREADVIAEERARIARELHDVVAHSVSVMVVNAGAARTQLGDREPGAQESLLVVERTGRQALAELRRLLGVLRTGPGHDENGSAPTPALAQLEALVADMRAAGLNARIERHGQVVPLGAGLEVSAYRIIQEALTNVVKHAGRGMTAIVRLTYSREALDIEVEDDGGSGSIRPALPSSGHGILGARERSALFGGWAQAGPLPGGGWKLQAHLPLPQEQLMPSSRTAATSA